MLKDKKDLTNSFLSRSELELRDKLLEKTNHKNHTESIQGAWRDTLCRKYFICNLCYVEHLEVAHGYKNGGN